MQIKKILLDYCLIGTSTKRDVDWGGCSTKSYGYSKSRYFSCYNLYGLKLPVLNKEELIFHKNIINIVFMLGAVHKRRPHKISKNW